MHLIASHWYLLLDQCRLLRKVHLPRCARTTYGFREGSVEILRLLLQGLSSWATSKCRTGMIGICGWERSARVLLRPHRPEETGAISKIRHWSSKDKPDASSSPTCSINEGINYLRLWRHEGGWRLSLSEALLQIEEMSGFSRMTYSGVAFTAAA